MMRATGGCILRQSTWGYLGALGWMVAAVFLFAAFAASGDGNTLGLAVAVLFYLGRRDAG